MTNEPASFLPLHPLEFRVLLALAKGPTHGFEIVQRIEEEERYGSIHPSNLYRRIRDLTEAKLIKEIPSPAGSADRRRYLMVTPLGRRVARAEAERLVDLVNVARLVNVLPERG